jgi:hypothetical protein
MRELTRPITTAINHVARAHLRIPAFGRATLRRDGAPDVRIRVGNISRAGYMGETDAPLRAGMNVRLVVPFGRQVSGTVRWSLNGRFGCALDTPFRGHEMLAISVLAGVRASTILLLVLLVAALTL